MLTPAKSVVVPWRLKELEGPDLMWPEAVRSPDPLQRADTHSQRGCRPLGRTVRCASSCGRVTTASTTALGLGRTRAEPHPAPQQLVDRFDDEALRRMPYAQTHYLRGAATLGGRQEYVRPPDMPLRTAPIRHNRLQPHAIAGGDVGFDPRNACLALTTEPAPRKFVVRPDPILQCRIWKPWGSRDPRAKTDCVPQP